MKIRCTLTRTRIFTEEAAGPWTVEKNKVAYGLV